MTIEIIEHVDKDTYVYDEGVENFARVYLPDGTRTKYAISDHGRVWSECRGGRFLKPRPKDNGYVEFCLYSPLIKGDVFRMGHILVADAFLLNDDPAKTQIDHKNTKRYDNRVCNLERVTPEENTKRTYTISHREPSNTYKIFAYSITDRTRQVFDSLKDASVKLDLDRGTISDVCNHRKNSCGGFIFGRAEEFDKEKLDAMIDNARFQNAGRAVIHILKDGTVDRYENERDACRKTGTKQPTMNLWLRGVNKPRDGTIWKYESEDFVPRKMGL